MRHIAAYLLLQIGGNPSPSSSDIKKVLSAVGIEADDDRLDKLISELKGKDINAVSGPILARYRLVLTRIPCAWLQLIAEGSSKLASVRLIGVGVF